MRISDWMSDVCSSDLLTLHLQNPLEGIPPALAGYPLELSTDRQQLVYTFDAQGEHTGIDVLLRRLGEAGIDFKDLKTSQSSLEDIFVNLLRDTRERDG